MSSILHVHASSFHVEFPSGLSQKGYTAGTFIPAVPHVLFPCREEKLAGLVMAALAGRKYGCLWSSQSCCCCFTPVIPRSRGLYWQLKFLTPAAARCWLSSFLPSTDEQWTLE